MPSFQFDAYDDGTDARDSNRENARSNDADQPSSDAPPRPPGTPFVGVRFKCCKMYGRIYRKTDGKAFEGRCPKCGAYLTVPIGHGGSASRFFDAG